MTVTADFNGDGIPDLASADGNVQLGNGDGTFKTVTGWTNALGFGGVQFFAVGDFNGDGKPDLLIPPGPSSSSTIAHLLLGDGDGTFQSAVPVNLGVSIQSVVVADVNGDGKQDLVGFNSTGGGLLVFLGKGDGTFTAGASYPTVSRLPTLGDFNGDGRVDLVFVDLSGAVQVLIGNGDGTFQPAVITPGATGRFLAAVGDFNGDGKLDLAVGSSTGQLFILGMALSKRPSHHCP